MYQYEQQVLEEGQSGKYILYRDGEPLRYLDFIKWLQQEQAFRLFFINLLSEVSFRAYQWETPPVTGSNTDRTFEFAIYDRPSIDLPPDPGPFRQYFESSDTGQDIAVFNNLGNDARLIAPAPEANLNYSHIGVFTRQAPIEQQHALWKTVGRVTEKQISDQPIWLNTAGGGVAWLHVRLDSQPKYYQHRPYMQLNAR